MNWLRYAKNAALDIFFPPVCFGCKSSLHNRDKILCESCESKISAASGFFCPECGNRLPELVKTCHKASLFIAGAPERYGNEPVTELVRLLKYGGLQKISELLGNLLADFSVQNRFNPEGFLIVPVPLSKRRERERGFNQAEEIAKVFAKKMNLPEPSRGIIARSRHTVPQTEMKSRENRLANVIGCFELKSADVVRGQDILLIDDVMTTGATLTEAAKALKIGGAKTIVALTVLRA